MEVTLSFQVLEWLHRIKNIFHIHCCCCSINRRNMYSKYTLTEMNITVSWGVVFFFPFSFWPLRWAKISFTLTLKDSNLKRTPFIIFFKLGSYYLENWEQLLSTYLSLCSSSWTSGCFSSEDTWASVCESTCGVTSAAVSSSGAGRESDGWMLPLPLAHPCLEVSSTCTIELVSLKESEPALKRWNNLWPAGKYLKNVIYQLK